MLKIELKQHIRDFFQGRMDSEISKSRIMRTTPAIIIRDYELEQFIDDLWVDINKKEHGDKK